jgi:trimethylamine-N-oxide reductase cytochrome c-type subunit TorC
MWTAGAILGLLVLVFAVPITLTATPKQCTTCHEMKPYYDSMTSSSHRAAAPSCLFCHVRPGVFNRIAWEVTFYHEIAGHFSGAEVTSTAANAPSLASCSRQECHSLNREVSNAGDLAIKHRLHVVDEKIGCSVCHPGAVHTNGGRLKLPPATLCKRCHAAKMKECKYCHTGQRLLGAPSTPH